MTDSHKTKRTFLGQQGVLNPRPEDVQHESFRDSEFFDPEDLLQVKYEMLRQVEVDNKQSAKPPRRLASLDHRSSRHRQLFRSLISPVCCHTNGDRDPDTSWGRNRCSLWHDCNSPSRGSPLTNWPTESQSASASRFTPAASTVNYGIKKTPVSPESAAVRFSDRRLVTAYEELRSQAAQGRQQGPGLTLMMARGFRSWMETCSQLFTTECSRTPISDRLEPSMPSGLRGEVVLLLVSMMLHRVSKEVV
jgi:hypothetical protein